ncbi:hypothetical protein R1sor_026458 [Riccia sorocarpa]|uniref:Neprosin PEP catalytic domain-containing protein n=1 Tax=Riccia sorocarpa TaxID=122646 RepID=A0ABD3GEQ8_9MARC
MENYLVISVILVWSFCLQYSYSVESALNYKLSNGEEISCVPIYEQPSLNSLDRASNAYLKEPAFLPSDKSTEEQTQVPEESEIRPAEQLFHSEVGTCPEGMIPILRNQRSLRRTRGSSRQGADSILGNYGHKLTVTSTNTSEADPADDLSVPNNHEYATYRRKWPAGSKFLGAKGYFNIWNPSVEAWNEFSLSQMWIAAGSYDEKNLNTIEVGWQVYERLYQNKDPHFFIFWTRDGYKSTGCYNLNWVSLLKQDTKWLRSSESYRQ